MVIRMFVSDICRWHFYAPIRFANKPELSYRHAKVCKRSKLKPTCQLFKITIVTTLGSLLLASVACYLNNVYILCCYIGYYGSINISDAFFDKNSSSLRLLEKLT